MKWKHLAALLPAALCAALAGCGDGSDAAPEIDLAIVSGYHANAPAPAWQSATVTEAVLSSTAGCGSVCVIVNDGAPYVAADYDIAAPEKNLSATKRAEIAQAQSDQILAVLAASRAVTPEADALAAITLAARSLEDAQGEKYLLVADSGLSTAGYLDWTQNLLRASSQAVLAYLEDMRALPDLTGVRVVWVGLGDVAGDQTAPTPANLETLRSVWSDVLYAAGASSVEFAADLPAAASDEAGDLPYVTPVEIRPDAPIEIDPSALTSGAPLVLDEEKILFLADTAVFADHDAAAATLRPVADYMAAHQEFTLLIAGTTATAGSNESCKALSQARAEAVKELLLSMGAEDDRIAGAVGLGYAHKYHTPDLDAQGRQTASAAANRSVMLFDAASEAALEILSG